MADFHGQLYLSAEARDGRTVLAAQAFRAPFHVSKPYWDADTGTLFVQVVNPTAGILSGDKLESDITVATGAALLVTTPSASRVFQMHGGSAKCSQHFSVNSGGWLEVMPEPLVPHRGCRYRQVTRIEVELGGGLGGGRARAVHRCHSPDVRRLRWSGFAVFWVCAQGCSSVSHRPTHAFPPSQTPAGPSPARAVLL